MNDLRRKISPVGIDKALSTCHRLNWTEATALIFRKPNNFESNLSNFLLNWLGRKYLELRGFNFVALFFPWRPWACFIMWLLYQQSAHIFSCQIRSSRDLKITRTSPARRMFFVPRHVLRFCVSIRKPSPPWSIFDTETLIQLSVRICQSNRAGHWRNFRSFGSVFSTIKYYIGLVHRMAQHTGTSNAQTHTADKICN